MEARAQAEPSNEPRSLSSSFQRSRKRPPGNYIHKTHNRGNTEGGGNDPRNIILTLYSHGYLRAGAADLCRERAAHLRVRGNPNPLTRVDSHSYSLLGLGPPKGASIERLSGAGASTGVLSSTLGVARCGGSAGCVLCVLWAISAAVWGGSTLWG